MPPGLVVHSTAAIEDDHQGLGKGTRENLAVLDHGRGRQSQDYHEACSKRSSRCSWGDRWPWDPEHDIRKANLNGIRCRTPRLNTMMACKEAYKIGSGLYIAYLGVLVHFQRHTSTSKGTPSVWDPPISFSPKDVFWDGFQLEDIPDVRKIERLAIQVPFQSNPALQVVTAEEIASLLSEFRGVKHLTILLPRNFDPQADNPGIDHADLDMIDAIDIESSIGRLRKLQFQIQTSGVVW